MINTILKVTPDGSTDEEAVIVRVFTERTTMFRDDPHSVVYIMELAAESSIGAPVLAEFNNGLVYKFTPGEMAIPEMIPHDQHLQR